MTKDQEIRRLKRKQDSICTHECQAELEKGRLGDDVIRDVNRTLENVVQKQDREVSKLNTIIEHIEL